MKWGLAGYGDISERRVAQALQTAGNELVSVWGRQFKKAQDFARRHNICTASRNIEELLMRVEAVYVATPVVAHVEIAKAALLAGKHVLIEKPVSPNLCRGDGLVSLARSQNLRAGVAYYRRLFPALERVKEMLEVTSVRHVEVTHTSPFAPNAEDTKAWRLDASVAGAGCLADTGSHRIDVLIWLLGFPQSVSAKCEDFTSGGVERKALLRLKWANGPTADCFFDWQVVSTDRITIFTDSTRFELNPLGTGRLELISNQRSEEFCLPPPANPHIELVKDFQASVSDGREPVCPLASGIATDHVIEAALRSHANGGNETPIQPVLVGSGDYLEL